jgi:hypothetical protein
MNRLRQEVGPKVESGRGLRSHATRSLGSISQPLSVRTHEQSFSEPSQALSGSSWNQQLCGPYSDGVFETRYRLVKRAYDGQGA